MSAQEPVDVVVIGAGPAGLAAAGALRLRDVDVVVLELSDAVGSSWRNRHDHLQLNTHRRFSHLPGLRMGRKVDPLPSKDDFIAYLEEYVRHFEIPVEYGVAVERIDPGPDGTWTLQCAGGERRARHVVVATGSDRVPFQVGWPGQDTFPGRVIHAAEFRNVADHAGRDVVIVGAGNSGVDVANHLCRSDAGQIWLSVRSGPTILPLRVLGQPLHPVAVANRRLPVRLQDGLMAMLSRLFYGDLRRYGIPKAGMGALSRALRDNVTVSLDDGCVAAIKAGRVQVVPVIDRFDGPDAVLADGNRIQPDDVICATGYRPGLDPLVGHLVELDGTGWPPAYGGEPTPGRPGLWFFGVNSSFFGNMYSRLGESRRLARHIAADLHPGPRPRRRLRARQPA